MKKRQKARAVSRKYARSSEIAGMVPSSSVREPVRSCIPSPSISVYSLLENQAASLMRRRNSFSGDRLWSQVAAGRMTAIPYPGSLFGFSFLQYTGIPPKLQ